MTRISRNPFGQLHNEVKKVQEELIRVFGRLLTITWQGPAGSGPLLNIWEDEQSLYAEADIPGIDPAKLDISVTEGNQLTIQGERIAPEIKAATWIRQERPFGTFVRVISLPSLVDADKVEAKYENGVLGLVLPKSEAAKPRKIAVKGVE
jgi:HSP20 family protein